jgi:hypothetical protein
VIFITNLTTAALSLVVTVQRTPNATYHGDYNTYPSIINSTRTTEIIYTFVFNNGQLPAGNYTGAVQFDLANVNHTRSSDTYSIKTTSICGNINTVSGNFQ